MILWIPTTSRCCRPAMPRLRVQVQEQLMCRLAQSRGGIPPRDQEEVSDARPVVRHVQTPV
jgi:hypothetical protein